MVVEVYRGFEGDLAVPNGTRDVVEAHGICDKCGDAMNMDDYAFPHGDGYVCVNCFVKLNQKHTVNDLAEFGEVEIREH